MESLLTQFSAFKVEKYVGIEDGADKASFLFSVAILAVCSIIISTKQYVTTDISCYIPIVVSGSDFEKFIRNYCWVHGTIPFRSNESLPQTKEEWMTAEYTRKINYYQWVPFVLGLQGVLFYLPRLIWRTIIYNLSGNHLEGLVVSAQKATNQVGDNRKETIEQIAKSLEDLFLQRRVLGHKKFPVLRQKMSLVCCGRRTGIFLVSLYFVIKILYLINAIGQILLMQNFLRLGTTKLNVAFGWTILHDIISGKQWTENLLFPRTTFCFIGDISLVAVKNHFVAQCTLPINMLNEKIYIFLWFWTVGVLILTLISIPLWLWRMTFFSKRQKFVKKFLKIKCSYSKGKHKELMSHFVERFLRHDGIFILHIISLNAGDLIAADVVTELWQIYTKYYVERDFSKNVISIIDEKTNQSFV
uniref:Innexin n=1 Tax=Dugesia japonica TaxID=6161 RepID=Q2L6M5_DUGJA|nr:innexin10 [Dugesia japonica]